VHVINPLTTIEMSRLNFINPGEFITQYSEIRILCEGHNTFRKCFILGITCCRYSGSSGWVFRGGYLLPHSPLGIDPQEDCGSSWSAKQPERPQWKRRIKIHERGSWQRRWFWCFACLSSVTAAVCQPASTGHCVADVRSELNMDKLQFEKIIK